MAATENNPRPEFIVSGDVDERTTQQLEGLRTLIDENPALAHDVISLYAESGTTGDRWAKILGGKEPERRYPFQLTSYLSKVADSKILRHVEFDSATERQIRADPDIKSSSNLRARMQGDLQETVVKRIQLQRLGIYAARLGTWYIQNPTAAETPLVKADAS